MRTKQEWEKLLEKELPFLQGGWWELYCFLLALATSKADVERLHALLPANCQVFGRDLAALKRLRDAMYAPGMAPRTNSRFPDLVCEKLLGALCHPSVFSNTPYGLADYYLDVLMEGKEECLMAKETLIRHLVYPFGSGEHYSGQFSGKVLNKDVEIEVYFEKYSHPGVLEVRFVLDGRRMNPAFVEAFRRLSWFPGLKIQTDLFGRPSVERGETGFWLTIPDTGLINMVSKKNSDEYRYWYVVCQDFLVALNEVLLDQGVDVDLQWAEISAWVA